MRWIYGLSLGIAVLAGCAESPQEPDAPAVDLNYIERLWTIEQILNETLAPDTLDSGEQDEGELDVTRVVGTMVVYPPGEGPDAKADVYSNETGATYWVGAQAPIEVLDSASTVGAAATLEQYQLFRKIDDTATLEYVVSDVLLEAIDANANDPTADECPWMEQGRPMAVACIDVMSGSVEFAMEVTRYLYDPEDYSGNEIFIDSVETMFTTGGFVEFYGYRGNFHFRALSHMYGTEPLWSRANFDSIPNSVDPPRGGQIRLRSDLTIAIPLDSVALDGVFDVTTEVVAASYTRRQRESYMSAYFRDPLKTAGLSVARQGLQSMKPRSGRPRPEPAAPCTTDAPGAGTLRFDTSGYAAPELPRGRAWVVVTRTGASEGVAAARITTKDGTATAGADYQALDAYVIFADGELGSRLAQVPVLADTLVEDDETVQLMLEAVPGCGSLGSPSTATLTILDDDDPPVPPSYTVGGTVTGLSGSGLVVTNLSTADLTISANGAFVFDREYGNGAGYNVRVATQPSGPTQVCTVVNGAGFIDETDVTDIEVECVTPPPDASGLDPDFGDDGKAGAGLMRGASDMALQSDGKIVLVGGNTLARYNPEGDLDAGFGSDGEVTVDVYGASYDVLNAVAIQPDGAIVVAGSSKDGANSPVQEDLIVARYTANGVLDASFGTGGVVVTDFEAGGDAAYDVLIQPDGAIVVTGTASVLDGFGIRDADFAAVRYTSAGVLDSAFGTNGRVTTNVAGRTDLGYAATLQADGKIVLAGRVANSGGADPDVGLVRYDTDGNPDPDFGADGVVRVVTADVWDEAADVAVRPDGMIVVAGLSRGVGGSFGMMVSRFDQTGTPDAGFGTAGTAVHDTDLNAVAHGMALQPDGKIVVAGFGADGGDADFVLRRLNEDGTADDNLVQEGRFVADFFGAADVANAVVIQGDGKIVTAGSVVNGTNTRVGMLRVVPLEHQR